MPTVPMIHVIGAPHTRRDVHHFGGGIHPEQIAGPTNTHHAGNHHRSWMNSLELMDFNEADGDERKSGIDKNGHYQVCLDIQHFAPNEISVRVEDRNVVIEAKHPERLDEFGAISREFKRRYELPEGFDPKDITSSISSDGVLIVRAPPAAKPGENVRHVQIHHTGIPHIRSVRVNKASERNANGK